MGQNVRPTSQQIADIRSLDDADLADMIAEIDDRGWIEAAHILEFVATARRFLRSGKELLDEVEAQEVLAKQWYDKWRRSSPNKRRHT